VTTTSDDIATQDSVRRIIKSAGQPNSTKPRPPTIETFD
jgi:hypothetical protein